MACNGPLHGSSGQRNMNTGDFASDLRFKQQLDSLSWRSSIKYFTKLLSQTEYDPKQYGNRAQSIKYNSRNNLNAT